MQSTNSGVWLTKKIRKIPSSGSYKSACHSNFCSTFESNRMYGKKIYICKKIMDTYLRYLRKVSGMCLLVLGKGTVKYVADALSMM